MTDCKTISELLGASRKVHLAQIKLAPSYFPIASRSFSEPVGVSQSFSESLNFSEPLRAYQMDILDGIVCATKAFGKSLGHCVRWARSALRVTNKQLQSSAKPSEARPRRAKRGSARSAAQSGRAKRDPPPPKVAAPAEGGTAEGGSPCGRHANES